MSEYLGTKTVLVYDRGMYLKIAERLARDFKTVYYYNPMVKGQEFPKYEDAQIGANLEDIEKVIRIEDFFDYYDEIDLFVFPGNNDSDLSDFLIREGKRVWASGKADQLELDRSGTLDYLKELGLATPDYEQVNGLDNLREYLKTHKDVFVKLNLHRGTQETFHSPRYELVIDVLNHLEEVLGPVKNRIVFYVFKPIKGVELAFDGYSVNGQFPERVLLGVEVKDMGYGGRIKKYKDLYPEVLKFNNAISETLKVNNYRNFISPEMRVDEKTGVGYMTDCCCRQPSPVSEVYYELITNFSEVLWNGGNNEFTEAIYSAEFAMTLIISCDFAMEHWASIYFPKEISKWVKLRNYTYEDGTYRIAPNRLDKNDCIGVVVAIGNSFDDCAKKLNKCAEMIEGNRIKIPCAVVGDVEKEIAKAESIGIKF